MDSDFEAEFADELEAMREFDGGQLKFTCFYVGLGV